MDNHIILGSIGAIARRENQSLAETFIGCEVVIIIDTSGSMASYDSRGGLSRYAVACEELESLQNTLPGKIAVIAFSGSAQFCPSGIPIYFGESTNLAGALRFTQIADVPGIRFIVISDGRPDSESEALRIAGMYKNRIDTIFVGPENDHMGRDFLDRLSRASGGKTITADRVKELSASVQQLLLDAGD